TSRAVAAGMGSSFRRGCSPRSTHGDRRTSPGSDDPDRQRRTVRGAGQSPPRPAALPPTARAASYLLSSAGRSPQASRTLVTSTRRGLVALELLLELDAAAETVGVARSERLHGRLGRAVAPPPDSDGVARPADATVLRIEIRVDMIVEVAPAEGAGAELFDPA